ncbi:GspE/PulE family protein [Desulfotomaculum nigrificans]|uniref:GspE/PulE family protein n=1 Tax=Desulfotomaculum nigrificans TaxID=1565 RepID=UPI0001FAE7DB|nr:GspE/PulE family protein [Desulfotomaculum nigrificans]
MPTPRESRKLLGNILIENKIITQEQLNEALKIQQTTGERLGKILINLGYVTERDLTNMLEAQLGIPQVAPGYWMNAELMKLIPEHIVRRYKAIPVAKDGNILTVAMVDPLNLVAIDDLRLITGMEIDTVLASERDVDNAIQKFYGMPDLERELQDFEVVENQALQLEQPDDMMDEAPIVRLVNSIIVQAINDKASDIHIEPYENGVRVRFRVDGILREAMVLPKRSRSSLASRFKILAQLNIAEKRVPQDGRIQIKYGEREIDLRVSTMPTIFGEKVVIRLLDKTNRLTNLNQLGFSDINRQRVEKLLKSTYGMLLITGPTGSGKTTTLYSALLELNNMEKNIITIEDPVEYMLEGINQTQVNPKAGLNFATGLRSMLRQDPDIIMVGEIRDKETAEIAIRAATTGHLVLSTLHTNDAAGALTRLIDMEIEPFLVSSSVMGVVAQRLIRKICPHCCVEYTPAPDGPERIFLGIGADQEVKLYRGNGCALCGNTGYRERMAIHEVLIVTKEIRKLVNEKASADEIKMVALNQGMITLKEDGIAKALQGLTTIAEVMRVAYSDED